MNIHEETKHAHKQIAKNNPVEKYIHNHSAHFWIVSIQLFFQLTAALQAAINSELIVGFSAIIIMPLFMFPRVDRARGKSTCRAAGMKT